MPSDLHDNAIQLRITGMTCGACVQRVENALKSIDGVRDATVNLMAESGTVQLTEDASAFKTRLRESVRNAGYDAEVLPADRQLITEWTDDSKLRESLRRHRQALIQALGLALPILGLEYALPYFWPGDDPAAQLPGRLLQLILLIMLIVSPAGGPIIVGGLRALWHRTGNMDLLITVAVLSATIGGLVGSFIAEPKLIHFHAAAMILAIVCIGRYLETKVRGKATGAIGALAKRAPKQAEVKRDGAWQTVQVDSIYRDDDVQVIEGATVPVDGEVIDGSVEVDEQILTGEPMPVLREVGDALQAGMTVVNGRAVIRAAGDGSQGTLDRILALIQAAQEGRTRMQRLADQVAGVFVALIVAIAIITFFSWGIFGDVGGWAMGTRAAIAVLVVACPCALGLATPTVTLAASGVAAQRGILPRDAAALEALGRIKTIVWDKTGTLTAGTPQVQSIRVFDVDPELTDDDILRLAAGAERFSAHPIGKAIVRAAQQREIDIPTPASFESTIGRGLRAEVDARRVVIGSARWLTENDVAINPDVEPSEQDGLSSGVSSIYLAIDGTHAAIIELSDGLRPSASAALQRLRRQNIHARMLTGDAAGAAQAVAREIGIESDKVEAEATPQRKIEYVEEIVQQAAGVAMVGDGINDAAALARADVGIAFATGADVAVEAADISLIGSTPHLVADAVVIARATTRLIRQNLGWAFGYNIIAIPLAATGTLPPALAAAAMMFSSIAVVLNAMRLPRLVAARLTRQNETN